MELNKRTQRSALSSTLSILILFSSLLYVASFRWILISAEVFTTSNALHNQVFQATKILTKGGPIEVNPATGELFCHNSSGLYVSTDHGGMWTLRYAAATRLRSMYFTSNGILLICNGSTILRSTDGGASFVNVFTLQGRGMVNAHPSWSWSSFNDTQILVGEYDAGDYSSLRYVYMSMNAGQTWQVILNVSKEYNNKFSSLYGSWKGHVHKVLADPYDGAIWVTAGDNGYNRTIFCSTDYGNTWSVFYGSVYRNTPERPTAGVALEDRIIWGDDGHFRSGWVYIKSAGEYYLTQYESTYHHFFSMSEHNRVVYAGTCWLNGDNLDGLWGTIDGFNWYFLWNGSASDKQGVPIISKNNDGSYFYFMDGENNVYRATLLTRDEFAHLFGSDPTSAKVLVDSYGGEYSYLNFTSICPEGVTITVQGVNRTNYVRNSGFEVNTNPHEPPDYWTLSKANVTWKHAHHPDGTHYLIFNHYRSDNNLVVAQQIIDNLEGGVNYLFRARVKYNGTQTSGDFPSDTAVYVKWCPSGGGVNLKNSPVFKQQAKVYNWTYIREIITPPQQSPLRATICFQIKNNQGAWFIDDIHLEKIGPSMEKKYLPALTSANNESVTLMSQSVNITVINSQGQSETFKVGTLNDGQNVTVIPTIPLVGIVKIKADVAGSKVIRYNVAYATQGKLMNAIFTSKQWEVYVGRHYGTAFNVTAFNLVVLGDKNSTITITGKDTQKLSFQVSAPPRTVSSTKVYCGSLRRPLRVEGASDWSYDEAKKILTITANHQGTVAIEVIWEGGGESPANFTLRVMLKNGSGAPINAKIQIYLGERLIYEQQEDAAAFYLPKDLYIIRVTYKEEAQEQTVSLDSNKIVEFKFGPPPPIPRDLIGVLTQLPVLGYLVILLIILSVIIYYKKRR